MMKDIEKTLCRREKAEKERRTVMRGAAVICMSAVLIGSLSGCVTKTDLKNENENYLSQIVSLEDKVEELKKVNVQLGGKEVPESSIYTFGDGTSTTYVSIGGNIALSGTYALENSTQAPNTASVGITANTDVRPSSNWVTKQDGTKTMFYHPSGVTGYMQAGKVLEPLKSDTAKASVEKYIAGEGMENRGFSEIFLEDVNAGGYCDGAFQVADGSTEGAIVTPMICKVGVFGTSDNIVQFMFTYKDDVTANELVMSLLRTLTVGTRQLRVE